MSSTELHAGILKEVFIDNGFLSIFDEDLPSNINSFSEMEEYLYDNCDGTSTDKYSYVFADNRCFYWERHDSSDDVLDLSFAQKIDGGYFVSTAFYNGGCGLGEAIEGCIQYEDKRNRKLES